MHKDSIVSFFDKVVVSWFADLIVFHILVLVEEQKFQAFQETGSCWKCGIKEKNRRKTKRQKKKKEFDSGI